MATSLIYTDQNRRDVGALKVFSLDLAYGSGENNFELSLNLKDHILKEGYFIYCENSIEGSLFGTEYGGIVDKIKIDTESNKVTYKGRTFHGILEGKIIKPLDGYDYYVVSGNAHSVLRELINYLGLTNLFQVSENESEIEIPQYEFRYDPAYSSINDMVYENGGKLSFVYDGYKVNLSVVPVIDYSQDEEWTSLQEHLVIEKNYNPINHLICLGQGDLKNRAIIHLFTDENGGLLPYSYTDNPMQDSDYILDTSQQVLFGIDEIEDKYDYPSAEIKENYIPLLEQPDNWDVNYSQYFIFEDDGYKELERKNEDIYSLLSTQPGNWSNNYSKYFTKSGSKYNNVNGISTTIYKKLSKKPNDWTKNWKNYYYFFTDGVSNEYRSVEGIEKQHYKMQTRKPTDWNDNYGRYYRRKKNGGYETVPGVKKGKKEYAPKWTAKKYFVKETYYLAPKWKANYFYSKTNTTVAPSWADNTFYSKTFEEIIPSFSAGQYYKKVYDRFYVLVQGGIERLKESLNRDSIDININELEGNYDINDIVGAEESMTGMSVFQPITKKIVKIQNNDVTLSYGIGGK